MNKKVVIIGFGGHGRVIADIVRAKGDTVLGFLDDHASNYATDFQNTDNNQNVVLGKVEDYIKYSDAEFIIGIGNNDVRKKLSSLNCKWYTAVHPSAVISPSVKIGEGSVISANTVINSEAVIGMHCIINTGSIIEHDCILEDFVHISSGVKLGGGVKIGLSSFLGVGSVIDKLTEIKPNTVIKAGSVIDKNI